MNSDELLEQDEIDALLNGVDGGDSESANEGDSGEPQVRPFDPESQHRIIRDRLHSLDIINERFARLFRIELFNLIRRNADITVGSVEYQSFSAFSRYIPMPANINLVSMKPLRGTGLIIFPPSMVFVVVDNLFGGDGRFVTKSEGREFTKTEQRIISRMLDLANQSYEESWQPIYPVEISYLRSEMQARFANITNSPNEIVVNTTFHLEVGHLESEFHVCLPYTMLEPIKELLTNPRTENQDSLENWTERMAGEIKKSDVELVSDFVGVERTLGEVVNLEVGDILPIELPKSVLVNVDDVPVMECSYGARNDHKALRVKRIIDHSFNGSTGSHSAASRGGKTSQDEGSEK